MGYNPNYQSEGRIYGQYILKNHPNAKIGILYQNDDLGRDYVTGLKEALGAKAASMIVAETSYELTDPTIDSQIVKLKAAGADLLYDASTPKFAAQAIKKVADLGWKPVRILDINAAPVSATLNPRASIFPRTSSRPTTARTRAIRSGRTIPASRPISPSWTNIILRATSSTPSARMVMQRELLVHILRQCGDDLTRENIMKQATSLKNVTGSLSLPGMVINTSPTDYRINKQMQMMKFNGERWELFGPIIEDTGPTG